MPFQRLHSADLNDDGVHVRRCRVQRTAQRADVDRRNTPLRRGQSDFGSVDAVNRLLQTTVCGLTRHASRSSQWRLAAMCIHRTTGMEWRFATGPNSASGHA